MAANPLTQPYTWTFRRVVWATLVLIFVYLLLLLFPLISEQSATIAAVVPDYYQNLRQWMVTHPNQFLASLHEFLPATLPKRMSPVQQTEQEVMDSAETAA